jgi:purine-binding chemotaxis protein CheW
MVARPSDRIVGVFSVGDEVARIIDVQALLAQSFTPRAAAASSPRGDTAASRSADGRNDRIDDEKFISFIVAGQEFALELDAVREVIAAPTNVAAVPHSEDLVIGVTAHRDSLLPLLSLRGLLGLGGAEPDTARKVLVSRIGGTLIGLVADQARAIVSVAEGESDPPPAVLAARTGAESQIKAVYRGEQGRRLISILSPDQLFRNDVMQRLAKSQAGREATMTSDDEIETASDRFLVFRLGDDEFALPIEAVIEVARVPEQITRVPKTPAFLEGVISFRGEVLPVVDQRRRFDMAVDGGDMTRRLIVVRSERHRAALIVDAVSEVLSHQRGAMDPAPDLTGDQTRLVLGVINLDEAGRMVMVLDPTELLSRAERSLLDAFAPELPEAR